MTLLKRFLVFLTGGPPLSQFLKYLAQSLSRSGQSWLNSRNLNTNSPLFLPLGFRSGGFLDILSFSPFSVNVDDRRGIVLLRVVGDFL